MTKRTFGKALRLVRKSRNLTQLKLAKRCELDRTFISLLERDLRQPTLPTIVKLSAALSIPPASLVGMVDPAYLLPNRTGTPDAPSEPDKDRT
jgi:transcriptional regulator with XRE-family HTH domain